MKLLQEVSRHIRSKIVYPLNDCLRRNKDPSSSTSSAAGGSSGGAGLLSKNIVIIPSSPLISKQQHKAECRALHTTAVPSSPSKTLLCPGLPVTVTKPSSPVVVGPLLVGSKYSSSSTSPSRRICSTSTNSQILQQKLSPQQNVLFSGSSSDLPQQKAVQVPTRNMASTPVGNDEALLASSRAFIPSLTNAMHKGQAGRIGVIGGSEEYTGAPYFAAISALKVGADLAHVFCAREASAVIKSYSPELIVHPLLDREDAVEAIMEWAPRMHCFVVGPGLGRDPKILNVVAQLIEKLREMDKPLIIDADGLFLITAQVELIKGYSKVILTPNSVEFSRLCSAVLGEDVKPAPSASAEKVRELAMTLGYVTILHKGATDVASNGRLVVCCCGGGSNRRCGGQGDLLAGSLAVLFHWALVFGDRGDAPAPPELLAAYGACRLTRECARLAYSQNGRSTTTTDLVRLIHQAFSFLFGP
jgi:ATP-dependent NAD(P)H-hydrate dehydratase